MADPIERATLRDIKPRHWLCVAALLALSAGVELAMGRSAICPCGHVALWHPALDAGNSQHIADWYTPSHIIHGLLFYVAGWLIVRTWPPGRRLVAAVAIEACWEMLENSPLVIDRYRATTIALGYTGDSVINSVSDVAAMALGFAIARRVPVALSIALGLALELAALMAIRDDLALNILMLVHPVPAVRAWQAGG